MENPSKNQSEKTTLSDLMPTDRLLIPAWASCLQWAIGEKAILDQFLAETGIKWTPPRTVIERMIDEASGADFDVVRTFVIWFNANIWDGEPPDEE